jgi:hypothetical protein
MNTGLGIGLLLLAAGLLLLFTLRAKKTKPVFRKIPAFERMQHGIDLTVEDGTRLHISLGRGELQKPQGAATLAGLGMLRYTSEHTALSDRAPIVTSGEGTLAILSRDTLQAAYKAAAAEELYDPASGQLAGLTPFSYAAGSIPTIRDETASTNIILGNFGSEVSLLADASERANTFTVGAADTPTAQAIIYASTGAPLVGEELFAAGAYSSENEAHKASLRVQDILRWLVILAMVGGSVLKLVGVL